MAFTLLCLLFKYNLQASKCMISVLFLFSFI